MGNIERSYDLEAAVEAHRAACARRSQWLRLSDMEYDAIAGSALRTANHRGAVDRLAADGDFDRWMRLQHLDRRNGTHEARDAILAFLGGQCEAPAPPGGDAG